MPLNYIKLMAELSLKIGSELPDNSDLKQNKTTNKNAYIWLYNSLRLKVIIFPHMGGESCPQALNC